MNTLDIRFLQAREPLIAFGSRARIGIAVEGARLTLPACDNEEVWLVVHNPEVNLLTFLVPAAVFFEVFHRIVCAGVDLFPFRHTRGETNLRVVVLNWHSTPRSVS